VLHRSPSVANNFAVYVTTGASLEMSDCVVHSDTGAGVAVEGGKAHLLHVDVRECQGIGVLCLSGLSGEDIGEVYLEDCGIQENQGGGMKAAGGVTVGLRRVHFRRNKEFGVRLTDVEVSEWTGVDLTEQRKDPLLRGRGITGPAATDLP